MKISRGLFSRIFCAYDKSGSENVEIYTVPLTLASYESFTAHVELSPKNNFASFTSIACPFTYITSFHG